MDIFIYIVCMCYVGSVYDKNYIYLQRNGMYKTDLNSCDNQQSRNKDQSSKLINLVSLLYIHPLTSNEATKHTHTHTHTHIHFLLLLFCVQFRFAVGLDWILIVLGVVFSAAQGALPISIFIFGDITNLFVDHDITQQIFTSINADLSNTFMNFTFLEDAKLNNVSEAFSYQTIDPLLLESEEAFVQLMILINSTSLSSSAESLSCVLYTYANETGSTAFDVLQNVVMLEFAIPASSNTCLCVNDSLSLYTSETLCLPSDVFYYGTNTGSGVLWLVYYILMLCGGVFLAGFLQLGLFQAATERQVHRIRLKFYSSILRQDISWFDGTSSGELTSKLNE